MGTGNAKGENLVRKNGRIRLFNQKCNGKFLRRVEKILTLEGVYHHNMVTRSTNPNYKEKFPTYNGVSISENFKDFQFFAGWCNNQVGFGTTGFVLEEDLLVPNNKMYSEYNCVFVPDVINSFLTFVRQKDRGLPVGVTWCESEGKYKSYCAQLNGKNKTIGRFNNPQDAYTAYCVFKRKMARELAETYKEVVDPRVTKALLDFEVTKYVKEKV